MQHLVARMSPTAPTALLLRQLFELLLMRTSHTTPSG